MNGKRFTHNGVVIVDHLKKDLIYIDGDENLLDFAEYMDKLQSENIQLKNEINMLKVTLARNEAYIDRLTHTSEWKTSAYDNKSYHTVLKEWEDDMIDKYSDKRKVTLRRYE